MAGLDFGLPVRIPSDFAQMPARLRIEELHVALLGSFLHNLLEWTAVCLAILTAVIAFVHFRMARNLVTPVLGAALLWSGCMDAFHTLASDHFIRRVADAERFIPITWVASRLFGCLVLLAGAAVLLLGKKLSHKRDTRRLLGTLVAFGAASYGFVFYCANSSSLPQCQFPGSWIPRPYDLIPVVLYLAVGLPLFRALYRQSPGPFSHSLLLCILPQVASQLHMAFGSSALYDSHFNIAHFLKIVAYAVPLSGLLLDYVRTYQGQANMVEELERSSRFLERERHVLQLVSQGASRSEVLDALALAVERMSEDGQCGILLLGDDRRRLLAASGPNLPPEYLKQVNGLEIGTAVGACGTAAFHNKTVVVEDIATDPRFAEIKGIMLGFGFRACWSVPIRDSLNHVLGTFAIYHDRPGAPLARELRLLEGGAQLAGNALERLFAEEQLRANMERMALAEKVAGFGIWEIDAAKRTITLSNGAAELAGSNGGVHPMTEEEMKVWIDAVEVPVDATAPVEYLKELRLEMPDGSRRWVRNRGRSEFRGTPSERITGAIIDITRQKEMLLGLEQARAAAEQAVRVKDMFLANMSHEIRTPMNGILGMISLLADSGVTEEQSEYTGTMRTCGETLLHLIDDVLDLAKIDAGKLHLEQTDFELRTMVEETVAMLRPAARTRGLEMIENVEGGLPARVTGDPQRLRQVLLNLMSNAVKFTERGRVIVEVRELHRTQDSVGLRIAVSDSGIGIPVAVQRKILEPFTQADNSTTRRYGGTGLGLSICCNLISMMGGSLQVESEPGSGSTFWFSIELPIARHAPPVQQPRPASIPASDKPLRILLAEDNIINQIVAVRILERMGHRVDVASNGREAVEAVTRQPFDLLLMDCQMPQMDGYEAASLIRQSGRDLPIIAMTANVQPEDRLKCERSGMNGFLPKPVSVHSLHAILEELAVNKEQPVSVT